MDIKDALLRVFSGIFALVFLVVGLVLLATQLKQKLNGTISEIQPGLIKVKYETNVKVKRPCPTEVKECKQLVTADIYDSSTTGKKVGDVISFYKIAVGESIVYSLSEDNDLNEQYNGRLTAGIILVVIAVLLAIFLIYLLKTGKTFFTV